MGLSDGLPVFVGGHPNAADFKVDREGMCRWHRETGGLTYVGVGGNNCAAKDNKQSGSPGTPSMRRWTIGFYV